MGERHETIAVATTETRDAPERWVVAPPPSPSPSPPPCPSTPPSRVRPATTLMRVRRRTAAARNFHLTTAFLSITYNFLVAVSCAYYVPHDALGVGWAVQSYAWVGSLLSAIGLLGILMKHSGLITSFSHYLLLDTAVSAIVRLLILHFFFESFYDHNVCTSSYDPTWSPQNFRHDIITSVRHQKDYLWQLSHVKRCRVALGAVQAVLVGLLICFTAAQALLAIDMRRFGKGLDGKRRDWSPTEASWMKQQGSRVPRQYSVDEKQGPEMV